MYNMYTRAVKGGRRNRCSAKRGQKVSGFRSVLGDILTKGIRYCSNRHGTQSECSLRSDLKKNVVGRKAMALIRLVVIV